MKTSNKKILAAGSFDSMGYRCGFLVPLLCIVFCNAADAQGTSPTPGEWVTEKTIFTDVTTGFPGTLIADTSVFQLQDGRWRMILDTGDAERSAISPDGLTFTMEPGTRFTNMPNGGMRPAHVKLLKLASGALRAYFSSTHIYSAVSDDEGLTFKMDDGIRILASDVGESNIIGGSVVPTPDGKWRMYFGGVDRVYSALSTDLLNWTPDAGPRIGPGSTLGDNPALDPFAMANADGSITLYFFHGPTRSIPFGKLNGIYFSTSTDGLSFATETFTGISYGGDPTLVSRPNGELKMYYNWGNDFGGKIYVAGKDTTLANISTRLNVQSGDNVMIGGFILTGTDSKRVVIRAIGPSLANYGVKGALADPKLELHKPDGTIVTNDNWRIDDATGQPPLPNGDYSAFNPSNDLESMILATLAPGPYSVVVRGVNGGTGVGVVEVYDYDRGVDSKLANISTRGFIQTGDNVMIGGVIVRGIIPGKVIVRAIGPSLGIANAIADPTLELHNGNGDTINSNDNWKIDDQTAQSQEAAIRATTIPPTNDLESAIVTTLAPGRYTAIVRGKNNATGVGLVEVYYLQ